MRRQAGHALDLLGPFLLEVQEDLLATIRKKYGDKAIGWSNEEDENFRSALSSFTRSLVRFSDDHEVTALLYRRYRECERILGMVSGDNSKTGILYEMLDEKSRGILLLLNTMRYATLNELSARTRSTHYEVLHRLQGVINPLSVQRFGTSCASFVESRCDPLTGKIILFSWWLNDEFSREPVLVEVGENGEDIFLTAEMPGLELPRRMRASATFNNGILEVTVQKGGIPDER